MLCNNSLFYRLRFLCVKDNRIEFIYHTVFNIFNINKDINNLKKVKFRFSHLLKHFDILKYNKHYNLHM